MPLKRCSSIDASADNVLNYGIALFDYGNVDVARSMQFLLLSFYIRFEKLYTSNEHAGNDKITYYYGLSLAWVYFYSFN